MAQPTKKSLHRMSRSMRRQLRDGWQRAVFAAPVDPERPERAERVLEGPGLGSPVDDADLDAIIAAAEEAAAAGLVKHTYVLDPTRRIQIDARHGAARVREMDPATRSRMMGGKERVLRPDRSADLLRVIGIMNADGSISARHARKYKQVNHFVELCRPAWEAAIRAHPADTDRPLRVLDLACGNGYLTFVLAEALRLGQVPTRLHGVDRRADLIERCRERAAALDLRSATFAVGDITDVDVAAALDGPPDLVLALHACDTATDDALALAIRARATAIMAAPCCQAELARQLAAAPLAGITRSGLLAREYASTLTDALRSDVLEACGYTVDVVEFVASEHTAKNLLLRARRRDDATLTPDLSDLRRQCQELGIEPALLRHFEPEQ